MPGSASPSESKRCRYSSTTIAANSGVGSVPSACSRFIPDDPSAWPISSASPRTRPPPAPSRVLAPQLVHHLPRRDDHQQPPEVVAVGDVGKLPPADSPTEAVEGAQGGILLVFGGPCASSAGESGPAGPAVSEVRACKSAAAASPPALRSPIWSVTDPVASPCIEVSRQVGGSYLPLWDIAGPACGIERRNPRPWAAGPPTWLIPEQPARFDMLRSARRTSRLPNPTEFARLWHFTVFFTATSPPQESNRDPGDDEAEVISTKDMLGRQVERGRIPGPRSRRRRGMDRTRSPGADRSPSDGASRHACNPLPGLSPKGPAQLRSIVSPGSSINTFLPSDPLMPKGRRCAGPAGRSRDPPPAPIPKESAARLIPGDKSRHGRGVARRFFLDSLISWERRRGATIELDHGCARCGPQYLRHTPPGRRLRTISGRVHRSMAATIRAVAGERIPERRAS